MEVKGFFASIPSIGEREDYDTYGETRYGAEQQTTGHP